MKILEFLRKIPVMLEENKIVLLVLDGLGLNELKLPNFKKEVYQTVFPSSTPAFFYSFHSLLPPNEHGFLEWYMRFKNKILTIPPWKTIDGKLLELGKDVRKKDVFPFKSLSEILHSKGFSTTYYTPYPDSTFTKATSKKAKVVGINFLSQVFPLDDSDFIFIYWPSADVILHERYKDDAFKTEIKMIETFIKILVKKLEKNCLLFILSDHGLIKCKKRYLLPKIGKKFPVGGSRVAFYKDVEKEEVEKEFKKRNIPVDVFNLDEIESFGKKVDKRCYKNFGNIVVIGKNNIGFEYPFERKEKRNFAAFHGGLTKEENFVNVWSLKKK